MHKDEIFLEIISNFVALTKLTIKISLKLYIMIKKILLLFVALTMAVGINAAESLKHEMRAAWIATVYQIDWPTTTNNASAQKAEFNAYLDKL